MNLSQAQVQLQDLSWIWYLLYWNLSRGRGGSRVSGESLLGCISLTYVHLKTSWPHPRTDPASASWAYSNAVRDDICTDGYQMLLVFPSWIIAKESQHHLTLSKRQKEYSLGGGSMGTITPAPWYGDIDVGALIASSRWTHQNNTRWMLAKKKRMAIRKAQRIAGNTCFSSSNPSPLLLNITQILKNYGPFWVVQVN